MDITNPDWAEIYTKVADFLVQYAFQILGAICILIIGWIFARRLGSFIIRLCEKRSLDPMMARFFGGAAKIAILIFVIIVALGKFGISIGPMVAALGAITFGASFAMQGIISNYGAGLAIILTRPFTIGHTIKVGEMHGVVEEVFLARTELLTEDGERILIPNKHIIGEIITNSFEQRLVRMSVGISYADDPAKVVSIILNILNSYNEVAKDPKPHAGIEDFSDSSIKIGLRYHAPTKKYYQVQFEVNMAVYNTLMENGIKIPFPQRDIHLVSGNMDSMKD